MNEHEVDLWYLFPEDVRDDALEERYHALISADEQTRMQRFVRAKDRRQFLLARALVRTTLSRYAPVPPKTWTFVTNHFGKPSIAEPAEFASFNFNLSHTTGLIACAVASDIVGVDVEYTGRQVNLQIAREYFSAAEVAHLESLPADRQASLFFDYWTLKEAYIKACGVGLLRPLQDFTFYLSATRPVGISFAEKLEDDPSAWQFFQDSPSPDHRTALAVKANRATPLSLVIRRTVPLAE